MKLLALYVITFAFTTPALANDIPVPPIPPDSAPVGDLAPTPDANAHAPPVPTSEKPSFDLKFYRARPYEPGAGFAPGSRYQTNEDRKPIQTPGFSVSVPLK